LPGFHDPSIDWRNGIPVLMASEGVDSARISEWLSRVSEAVGSAFVGDTLLDGVHVVSSQSQAIAQHLQRDVFRCRSRLSGLLGPAAFRGVGGDVVVLHFDHTEPYYRYLEAFFPEGEFGGSAGVQIREGYRHIALWGADGDQLGPTIAHELLHLAVTEDSLPLWLEEGLAQMFEIDMGAHDPIAYRQEDIAACKHYWQGAGLNHFWSGEGFSMPGDVQKHAYLLAEILVRNLISDYGRRSWFRRKKQPVFTEFVWATHHEDAGDAAARLVLGTSLEQIANQFLGPPR